MVWTKYFTGLQSSPRAVREYPTDTPAFPIYGSVTFSYTWYLQSLSSFASGKTVSIFKSWIYAVSDWSDSNLWNIWYTLTALSMRCGLRQVMHKQLCFSLGYFACSLHSDSVYICRPTLTFCFDLFFKSFISSIRLGSVMLGYCSKNERFFILRMLYIDSFELILLERQKS